MSRKAIIIEAANVINQKELPGARKDADNWVNFLTSDIGGAWDDKEILPILRKPEIAHVESLLRQNSDKYVFLAFSGHGYEEMQHPLHTRGKAKVLLNDREQDVDIDRLRPKGNKGVLIIDACRGIELQTKYAAFSDGVRKESSAYESLSLASESLDYTKIIRAIVSKEYHKKYWLENLVKSNNGIVTMQSCLPEEDAFEFDDDESEAGGLYTTLLISKAKYWWSNARSNSYYSTLAAHNSAKTYMKAYFPQQNPEYSHGDLVFPFAVKISK